MMFLFEYNTVTGEVKALEKSEETVAWFAVAVPELIYFFAEIAPVSEQAPVS